MSFLVYLSTLCHLHLLASRTKILVVLYVLLGLSALTSCGGAPAFADEPEPRVLPPTTATRPPGSEDVAITTQAEPDGEPTADSKSLVKIDPIANKHCQPSDVAEPDFVESANAVNIGMLAPTSVSVAEQAGLAMVSSANLARGDIEDAGGVLNRKVRIIVGDTQGDPVVARQEAEKMILQDCVVGLVGVYHSPVGMEIKEVAREYGIPVIFAEPYNDDIVADRYPEVFRIGPSSRMVNLGYTRWVKNIGDFNNDGSIQVTIIAEDTKRTLDRIESLTKVMTEHELNVKPLVVELSNVDFSSVIARIVAENNLPDFIFLWFNGDAGYTLMRALNEAGIGPTNRTLVVARQTALEHQRFWKELPTGTQTVVSKIGPWHSTVTPMGQAFADRYRTIHGFWPESYAFESYDAVWLLADAINRAETAEPLAVIEALENTNIELASGSYCFPQGNVEMDSETRQPELSCGFKDDQMWHQWPYVPILFLQYSEEGQDSSDMPVVWPQSFQNSISTTLTEED